MWFESCQSPLKYDEFLASTSDAEEEDDTSTEMEQDFNQSETRLKPVMDPRGSNKMGQPPAFRPG